MKKILLALVLLAALIAVSYYSANRSDSRSKKEFQDGYEKGSREAAVLKNHADSLDATLKRDRNRYDDSLKMVSLAYSASFDSLTREIEARDKEIAARADRRKVSTRKSGNVQSRNVDSTRSTVSHAQILTYYRKRLQGLPGDLSPYERSVALTEIREETSRKFSISTSDFQTIREANNLGE